MDRFLFPKGGDASGSSLSSAHTYRRRKWDVPEGVIGAGIAETDFGTAPAIRHALRNAVDENFLTYLPENLAAEAELACSEFLMRRFGWQVDPDRVHLVADVMAGFALAVDLFTRPGTPIIIPVPCYMPFLTEPGRIGREIIQVPMERTMGGRWVLDLEALEHAFVQGGELLVLCNPHNPLGQVMTRREQSDVAAIVSRHGGRVFEDAIHAPVVYPGSAYAPYATLSEETAHHTITAIATSKGWNVPGLKAAQLILTGDADQQTWLQRDPVPALRGSILGAVAAIAAYRESVDWLDEVLRTLAGNRDLLHQRISAEIPEADFRAPEATYLAWIGFTDTQIAEPAAYLRDRADLALTPGQECGAQFGSYIRFNFALQPAVLNEAIDRLAVAVGERTTAARPPSTGSAR